MRSIRPRLGVISYRQGLVGSPAGRGVAGQLIPAPPAVADPERLQLALLRHPFERGQVDPLESVRG